MMKRSFGLLLLFSHIRELSAVSSDDLNSKNKKYHPLEHTHGFQHFFGFRLLLYRFWVFWNHIKEKCVIIMCLGEYSGSSGSKLKAFLI